MVTNATKAPTAKGGEKKAEAGEKKKTPGGDKKPEREG